MGKRMDDGSWKDSCLDKIKPGEPFFVLHGQDMLAPEIVRAWAERARQNGLPHERYEEALSTAKEMTNWPTRKMPD